MKNMNNKNCFLILAYTPSVEKELMLINLVRQIKEHDYPIVLVSHNLQSTTAINLVDHYLFDSNNDLLNYYPTKGDDFHPRIQYNMSVAGLSLRSSFTSRIKYHGLSAASLMFNGLMLAKSLGYQKCHMLEYDSYFESIDEFKENEDILNAHDSVHYFYGPHDCMIIGSCGSFNLDGYSNDELSWSNNKETIKSIINSLDNGINNGMVEIAICSLMHQRKNTYRKFEQNLHDSKITIDLSHKKVLDDQDRIEVIPFRLNDSVFVMIYMEKKVTSLEQTVRIIVNESAMFNNKLNNAGEWNYFRVCSFDELEKIIVMINDKVIKTFDFVNEIDKDFFHEHSVGNLLL